MILPLFLAPLIIAVAVFRLYILAFRLRNGDLRFNRERDVFPPIRASIAYVALLLYTAFMAVFILKFFSILFFERIGLADIVKSFYHALIFPIAYVVAEWAFFYGFKAKSGSNVLRRDSGN